VEEDERRKERMSEMAKRPDLSELDVPEWAELVLHSTKQNRGSY
jgi:hypothetical protein